MRQVNQTLPSAGARVPTFDIRVGKGPSSRRTVYFVGDKSDALQSAQALVTQVPDYVQAEVFEGDRRVARIGRGPKSRLPERAPEFSQIGRADGSRTAALAATLRRSGGPGIRPSKK